MKAIKIFADWRPRQKLGSREIKGKRAQQANKFFKNPEIKIVDVQKPKPGPTEVLIKIKACGICGSDVLMAKKDEYGYTSYSYMMANQVTIGHEFSGEVVKLGDKTEIFQKKFKKRIKIGTPVTAQCVIPCRKCQMCRESKFDLCFKNEERGFSVDGAMAEYATVDIREVFSIEECKKKYKEDLFVVGALIEPLAGVYKAIVEVGGGLSRGENAVVIGGGPIGLSAVGVLKALGAKIVILSEPIVHRREMGKKMGADFTIDPAKESLKEKVLELTSGEGAKIYFEAAGAGPKVYQDIEKLFQLGRPASKLILFGHGPGKMEVDPEVFIGTYSMIIGSHGHCGVWPEVIKMVARGLIDPRKMLTHRIGLDEVPFYLQKLQKPIIEEKVIVTQFK